MPLGRGSSRRKGTMNSTLQPLESVFLALRRDVQPLTQVQQVPIERIISSPYQVRDFAREQNLEELAQSIESLGLLQPLLLRPRKDGIPPYELIAGERRLRAAQLAGMTEVPALIVELEDKEALQALIVENAQRENLNALEESLAYQRLAEDFGMTQRDIAAAVGKKRATISNSLRLLQLDPFVLNLLAEGQISAGHGRALLMLDDAKQQREFARRTLHQALSVHALEKKIAVFLQGLEAEQRDEEQERLSERLERQREKVGEYLGSDRVQLKMDAEGNRRLSVVFESEAAWKRFLAKIRD